MQLPVLADELALPAKLAARATKKARQQQLGLPAGGGPPTRRSTRAGAALTSAKLAKQSKEPEHDSDSGMNHSRDSASSEEAASDRNEADYDPSGKPKSAWIWPKSNCHPDPSQQGLTVTTSIPSIH